jgi:hypothetical protein
VADSDKPRAADIDPAKLVPLTDEQRLNVLPHIVDLLGPLVRAYNHGMIVARTDEERAILHDIQAVHGPPDKTAY